ncbi:hypothetical protein D3C86_2160290 [compost metagenome]
MLAGDFREGERIFDFSSFDEQGGSAEPTVPVTASAILQVPSLRYFIALTSKYLYNLAFLVTV